MNDKLKSFKQYAKPIDEAAAELIYVKTAYNTVYKNLEQVTKDLIKLQDAFDKVAKYTVPDNKKLITDCSEEINTVNDIIESAQIKLEGIAEVLKL